MIKSLARVRYATTNYWKLQGLRKIPWGLWWFCWTMYNLGPLNFSIFVPLLTFPLALGLSRLAGRYYRQKFGYVVNDDDAKGRYAKQLALWLAVLALGIPLILSIFSSPSQLSAYIRSHSVMPVNWSGLLFIVGIPLFLWLETPRQAHYAVLTLLISAAIILLMQGYLPSLKGFFAIGILGSGIGAFGVFFGLTCLIGGLLDHFTLLRAMKLRLEPQGEVEQ